MLFQVSGCDLGFVQLVWEWSSCKLSAGVLRAAPSAPRGQCCPFTEGMEKQIGSMEGENSQLLNPFWGMRVRSILETQNCLSFQQKQVMTGKNETIWLVVNFGCLKTLKFDFIPGLIYLEASVCPAAAVCPVVRMPFRAAQGCSYCNMYIHSFSDTRSFQKCSVCSFFICEQMFFSRVGRQREIYWKTT